MMLSLLVSLTLLVLCNGDTFHDAHIQWRGIDKKTYSIVKCTKDINKLSCVGNAYACKVPINTDDITLNINTIAGGDIKPEYVADTTFGGGIYIFPSIATCTVKKKEAILFSEIRDKVMFYYEVKSSFQSVDYFCEPSYFEDESKEKLLVVPGAASPTSESFLLCYIPDEQSIKEYVGYYVYEEQILKKDGFDILPVNDLLPPSFANLLKAQHSFAYKAVISSMANKEGIERMMDFIGERDEKYYNNEIERFSKYLKKLRTYVDPFVKWQFIDVLLHLKDKKKFVKYNEILNKIKNVQTKYTLWFAPLKCAEHEMKKKPILIQQVQFGTINHQKSFYGIRNLRNIHKHYTAKDPRDKTLRLHYKNKFGCWLAECTEALNDAKSFKVTPETKISEIIKEAIALEKKKESQKTMGNVFVLEMGFFIGLGMSLLCLFICICLCFVFGLVAGYGVTSVWNTKKDTQ